MSEFSVEEFKKAWIRWKKNGSPTVPREGPVHISELIDEILYGPEFESPIERRFYEYLERCLLPMVKIEKQFSANTICGNFRIDFAINTDFGMIGIECDGKGFHVFERDMWRDAMILAGGVVKVMYRFSGTDIYNNNIFCLYNLALNHPELFKPAYAKGIVPDFHEARGRAISSSKCRIYGFGRSFYQFAEAIGGGRLDDVIAAYRDLKPEMIEEEYFDGR